MPHSSPEQYDVVVIGSGPGGYRAAVLGALRGLNVAIIERDAWGGCCLNKGCVPKKDWHHTAKLIAANKNWGKRGIQGSLEVDFLQAWEHQETVVSEVQKNYLNYMKALKIRIINGEGTIENENLVRIQKTPNEVEQIQSKHIVIATGATPYIPKPFETIPGKILTTDMLFDERPPQGDTVGIIGSGVIATEFAFILSMMGKKIHWLGRSPILNRLEYSPQALNTLKNRLSDFQIHMTHYGSIDKVNVHEVGVNLTFDGTQTLDLDWICLATGRTPHTQGLGLEKLQIETDSHGFIQRNNYLQTSVSNIYAIGDVASHKMTANHAIADATTAITNIIEGNIRELRSEWVPECIYSAIEMAKIGINDDQAEDQGFEPAVGFAAFETSPRALGQDDTDGFIRMLADMDSGQFLGAEIIGDEAGELIHLLSLAKSPEEALKRFAEGPYNHPARSEEVGNATETLANKWGLKELLRYS